MSDLESIAENKLDKTLPTIYKKRLPRLLSYPLGAEKISEALVGLAEFGSIGLEFYNNSSRDHGTETLSGVASKLSPDTCFLFGTYEVH